MQIAQTIQAGCTSIQSQFKPRTEKRLRDSSCKICPQQNLPNGIKLRSSSARSCNVSCVSLDTWTKSESVNPEVLADFRAEHVHVSHAIKSRISNSLTGIMPAPEMLDGKAASRSLRFKHFRVGSPEEADGWTEYRSTTGAACGCCQKPYSVHSPAQAHKLSTTRVDPDSKGVQELARRRQKWWNAEIKTHSHPHTQSGKNKYAPLGYLRLLVQFM